MRISVIIPCLNAASTIGQQLDALVGQSTKPWEVIVADNGSTDQTREIVSRYANQFSKLRIVDASLRKGAAHARNMGASAATGDYLAFCDADDVISENWLSALQTAFTEHHNFLASRFDYTLLNDCPGNDNQDTGLQNFRIPFLPFAGGCGLAIRRSLHQAVSGFDESLLHLEDVDYCLRIQLLGEPLVFVSDALIHIRYSTNPNQTFISARKATFTHAYNWGYGLAKVYSRYKVKGMQIPGVAPRLVLLPLWVLRSILSGFGFKSFERIGWHMGVLHGFLKMSGTKSQFVPNKNQSLSAFLEN